jgi:hypothetical protein
MNELPSSDWTWLNSIAGRFERAWRAGASPRIEDFLAGVEEGRRAVLLEELLRLLLLEPGSSSSLERGHQAGGRGRAERGRVCGGVWGRTTWSAIVDPVIRRY